MAYKYKKYIEESEEIRCGFNVTANRKKVWNIHLGLIEEVKKICKKHGLKYYADSGTLLGAIRHKGFIPRDDDTDLAMFRDDYDKFIVIAPKELPEHLVLQRNYHWGFAKLRNKNTVATDDNDINEDYLCGISLDIFPLDYMSKYKIINVIQKYVLIFIRGILISLKSEKIIGDVNMIKGILGRIFRSLFRHINYDNIYKFYDNVCKNTPFKDKSHVVDRRGYYDLYYDSKDFYNIKEVDFESIKINIPLGYDNILKRLYGDYKELVIYPGGHKHLYSVEKSFKEIIQNGKIDNSQLFSI